MGQTNTYTQRSIQRYWAKTKASHPKSQDKGVHFWQLLYNTAEGPKKKGRKGKKPKIKERGENTVAENLQLAPPSLPFPNLLFPYLRVEQSFSLSVGKEGSRIVSCTFYSPPPVLSRTGKNIKRREGSGSRRNPLFEEIKSSSPSFSGWVVGLAAGRGGGKGGTKGNERGGGRPSEEEKGGLKLDLGRGIADKKNQPKQERTVFTTIPQRPESKQTKKDTQRAVVFPCRFVQSYSLPSDNTEAV